MAVILCCFLISMPPATKNRILPGIAGHRFIDSLFSLILMKLHTFLPSIGVSKVSVS